MAIDSTLATAALVHAFFHNNPRSTRQEVYLGSINLPEGAKLSCPLLGIEESEVDSPAPIWKNESDTNWRATDHG
jgi:hypothetical protein